MIWKDVLAQRSLLYFFAAFINAGLQNVIPQVFFSEHYPQEQTFYLSICLLAGAAASLLTLFFSGHSAARRPARREALTARGQTLLVFLLLTSFWFWRSALPYILAFILIRACIQLLYNRMDHHYVGLAAERQRVRFARLATLFQLIGIMAGPLYFSLAYTHHRVNIAVLLLLALLFAWSMKGAFRPPRDEGEAVHEPDGSAAPEAAAERAGRASGGRTALFIAYLLLATTGVHIFANNAIMIVRDLYGQENAVVKSGVLLMLMNAAGIAAVTLKPWFCRRFPAWVSDRYAPLGALFLLCVLFLKWPLVPTYAYLILLSMLTGAVYGLFWVKTREYAIHSLAREGQRWVLTLYNNANNFSVLFSALVLFAASVLAARFGFPYLQAITDALLLSFGAALVFALQLDLRRRAAVASACNEARVLGRES